MGLCSKCMLYWFGTPSCLMVNKIHSQTVSGEKLLTFKNIKSLQRLFLQLMHYIMEKGKIALLIYHSFIHLEKILLNVTVFHNLMKGVLNQNEGS